MSVKVSRILHAGYIFEHDGARIAFDPIFENPFSHNCYAFPAVEFNQPEIRNLPFDAIFISHFHDDHCSLDSLNLLDKNIPIYIYCLINDIPELIKKLGFKTVIQININQIIKIKNFRVTVHRALDVDVDSLFQIQVAGLNILNVVDSWIDWETVEVLKLKSPWDLILWPFQTMRELEVLSPHRSGFAEPELPVEWLEQLNMLNPKSIVPSSCQFVQESWSWYNRVFFPISYNFFEIQIHKILPKCKVVRLNPGKSIELQQDHVAIAADLTWIKPTGDQNVDYLYDANLKIPTTSEVAQHFPKLLMHQHMAVEHFLTIQMIQHFGLLQPLDIDYFLTPRCWQLSTYDSEGIEKIYFYEIENSKMRLLRAADKNSEPIGWITEIAESKIYSALTDGESLTSLYIRINDKIFPDEIERQIGNTDATMDPLVRCLFSFNSSSYQQAQLLRIQQKSRL